MSPDSGGRPLGPGAPLTSLRGVGPARAASLGERGFHTLEDLLFLLPIRYEDRRSVSRVADVREAGPASFRGSITDLKRVFVRRRRLTMVRGRLDDGSGTMDVVWFNRPYVVNQIDEQAEVHCHGQVRERGSRWELLNPSVEPVEAATLGTGVAPVYPSVAGIGGTRLRRLVEQAVEAAELPASVPEWLPPALLERHRLPDLGEALLELHRPSEDADVEALNASADRWHRRLAYGELLLHQVELGLSRADARSRRKHHGYLDRAELDGLLTSLPPFQLTSAQERATGEIFDDLVGDRPMMRLLQGDVGCGKTIVAALAMAAAAESGLQAAFMAPTEILAEQHAESLRELLPGSVRIVQLTGSSSAPTALRRDIARGRAQIVVGTHALVQGSVDFARLGLAVVDEQHRFGVRQRRTLLSKGDRPDLLVMTATPIPRSLCLAMYGDLDLSVIDEAPPGRQPVDTRVAPSDKRRDVCAWLDRRLDRGSQAFVVLPLIDESESVEAASIERLGEGWRRRLERHGCATVHGRTPSDERREILARFAQGELRVLLTTTIVEVGIDVAGADVMVIESAERFGISQLHQLRGRVGRGDRASFCVVLHGSLSEDAARRLEAFAETTDGFRIAEADLAIRGPGDLLGTRQSGSPVLRGADLLRDSAWMEEVRRDARELLDSGREMPAPLRRRLSERGSWDGLAGG